MGLELIKRKNGKTTKKQCLGCKYDEFYNWLISDKDYCQLCDANGSERVQEKTDEKRN